MGKKKEERPKIEIRCPIPLRVEFERIVVDPTGLTVPEMIRSFMLEAIRLQKRYDSDPAKKQT